MSPRAARMARVVTAAACALPCCLWGPDPAGAEELRAGAGGRDLQATLDAASDGDTVVVPAGIWPGPIVIRQGIIVRGEGATIQGKGEGTVIRVEGAGAEVRGLKVTDSGVERGGPDACIYVAGTATAARIVGCHLSRCLFGIWLHEVKHALVADNVVVGAETGHRSNRGNGIHLFDSDHLIVRDNVITGGRDGVYVSAVEDTLITGNLTERTRYGVHYMFSYRNTLRGNIARHNSAGYALMQSRNLIVEDNLAEGNDGHGILFRDAQYSRIHGNRSVRNGEGLFFFSSTENTITDNRIIGNEVGARIWAGSVRNVVSGNVFVGNRRQIFYVSTRDLVWGVEQRGNLWGDYLGWDQDGDGVGDRPYRVDSFTANIVHRFPSAALLMRSPALELLSHLEQRLPLLRVATVIDRQPLMRRGEGP